MERRIEESDREEHIRTELEQRSAAQAELTQRRSHKMCHFKEEPDHNNKTQEKTRPMNLLSQLLSLV